MTSCRREAADNPYVPLDKAIDEMARKTPRSFGLPETLVIVGVAVTLLAIILPPVNSSVSRERIPAAFHRQTPSHGRSDSDHSPGAASTAATAMQQGDGR